MGAVGLAVFVQAYEITRSPAALGYLGLVQFVSMAIGVLGGSAFLDHLERRALLILTHLGFHLTAVALFFGSLVGDPPMVLIYVSAGCGSVFAAVHFPTRSSMIPPVVDQHELTTAMTLETIVWTATMIVGPLLGGLIAGRVGLAAVYLAAVACYALALALMLPLRRQLPHPEGTEGRLGVNAIRRGFSYLRPRPVLRALLWIDLIAMVLGMRRVLFPVLAVRQFGSGPEAVGLLMAAIPAGALAVSLTGNWLTRVRREGVGLVVAATTWGGAVALFGLSGDRIWLGLVLLAVGGGADIVAAILRATIIQREVPAPIRGRVWGINYLVLNGGPRLGDLVGGLTASAWGATFSVVAGGLATMAGIALYALAVPELARYRADDRVDPVEDPALWRTET